MLLLVFPPVDFYGIYTCIYIIFLNLHLILSSINVHVHVRDILEAAAYHI